MGIASDNLSFLYLIDLMTPTHRRIASVYVDWQADVYHGKCSAIFPSRKLIAAQADCSPSSVRDFIREQEGITIKHITRKQQGSYKHDSNLYEVDECFFETVVLLRYLNLWHKWDEVSKEIIISQSEDPHHLAKKAYEKDRLSTQKLPTVYADKLPTIKSYIKSYVYISTKKGVPVMNKEEKKKMGILEGMPLNFTTKQKLVKNFSEQSIRKAVEDYRWYEKKKIIDIPERLMIHQAKKHQHKFIDRI